MHNPVESGDKLIICPCYLILISFILNYLLKLFFKVTDLRMMNVNMPINGAAIENIIKCLRTRCLSKPSCIKNETKPNAAGPFYINKYLTFN
jgi:hypothetical protein